MSLIEFLKSAGIYFLAVVGIVFVSITVIALKNHFGWFEHKSKHETKSWREKYYSPKNK